LYGAALFIFDRECVYPLAIPANYMYSPNNSFPLLICHAIKTFSGISRSFDINGTVTKQLEKSYREYGGIQTPYFVIRKNNSFLLRLASLFKKEI
jgi:hypothetical protein